VKTPPDFEPPHHQQAIIPNTTEEFRRVYRALGEMQESNTTAHGKIFEALAEMRSDRRWFKWLAVAVIAVIVGALAMFISWSDRLGSVENKIDAHTSSSLIDHANMRRDIDRNWTELREMEHKVRERLTGQKD